MNFDNKSKFSLLAPAKINLRLKVLRKRSDGYHDLESLMTPLSVGDQVSFEATTSGFEGNCSHPEVPMGTGSLVEKAFRWAASQLGYAGGLKVQIQKEIPMGAGLGGGSSDAAAVIRAVEKLTQKKVLTEAYPSMAREIGADVPFFVAGGAQWVTGIGDETVPAGEMPSFKVLLVNAGLSISTKLVYTELKIETLTLADPVARVRPVFGNLRDLLPYVTNDLESVVLPRFEVVGRIKQRILTLGADAALMSGSGSTVFGLFADPLKSEYARGALKSEHPEWWIQLA